MKKALISPVEARETGYRVADVCSNAFPVAPPLYWVDCEDNITIDEFWYDPESSSFIPIPVPEVVEPDGIQPTVTGAQTL